MLISNRAQGWETEFFLQWTCFRNKRTFLKEHKGQKNNRPQPDSFKDSVFALMEN